MQKWLAAMVFLVGLFVGLSPAHASGDYGCDRTWSVDQGSYNRCSDLAMLSPGNDTRTNLLLLTMGDRTPPATAGQSPLFSWAVLAKEWRRPEVERAEPRQSHSRCQTDESGALAFERAVWQSRRLKTAERDLLIAVRQALNPNCDGDASGSDALQGLTDIQSKEGRAFGTYLVAANAFYQGNFGSATAAFAGLYNAQSPWLRETGRYMVGRSELNRAMEPAYGKYGWFNREDASADAASGAKAGFDAYLKDHPTGQYAASAKGLMRRVHWLSGDNRALAAEYGRLLAQADAGKQPPLKIIEELDDKLLRAVEGDVFAEDPYLIAMIALYRMRTVSDPIYADAASLPRPLSVADMDGLKKHFGKHPQLFEFLQAARAYYVEKDARAVIKMIPDDARRSSYDTVAFSRQMLRGLALEAVGDRNAAGFWQQLINGAAPGRQRAAVELALVMHWERNGALEKVFAANSPITEASIREMLLSYVASPKILAQQAISDTASKREQALARYVLIYKYLTRQRYGDVADALNNIAVGEGEARALNGPLHRNDYSYTGYDDYSPGENPIPLGVYAQPIDSAYGKCSTLLAASKTLAKPGNSLAKSDARLCVGDFLRTNGFDDYWIDFAPSKDELAGSKSLFVGDPMPRQHLYRQVLADKRATGDQRAYALYRSIWCYGPGGNNSCGGEDVLQSQRKAWFNELKSRYPKSRWAKDLKYYW